MYHGARWILNANGRFSKFIERGWEIFFMEEKESNELIYKKIPNVPFNFEAHSGTVSHSTYKFNNKII